MFAAKHNKPCLHPNMDDTKILKARELLNAWIKLNKINILNVARARASKDPEIYKTTMDILEDDKIMSYDELSNDYKYEIDDFIANRCWMITDQSLILKAIREILVRLPADVLDVLAYERDINVILPERYANTIYKHNVPIISNTSKDQEIKMKETWFVVLADYLHDKSYKVIIGTIVHEFAHVYLKHFHHDSRLHDEIEVAADEIATTWGFRDEIEMSKAS